MPYRIEFENYGPGSVEPDGTPSPSSRWATAPAQRVEITNVLPTQLDLDSFALTGFGFGDFNIALPEGAQSHQQILSMTYNGKTFEVWFEAALDIATRTLRIAFQSIDPDSELPPEVLVGFLPPEDGTGRGKGFVTYVAQAVAGLATGTAIRNIATISFDGQPGIKTNQVDPLDPSLGVDPAKEALVTIDAGGPTSSMTALPALVDRLAFTVGWSGTDDGSGIGAYDVYVSDNGGPFSLWLSATPQTSATYTGEDGHTYSFYSVATDRVGHRQSTPAAAQATTQINLPPQVVGVFGRGTGSGASQWNTAFTAHLADQGYGDVGDPSLGYRLSSGADQMQSLPWVNVNTISIQFSEAVAIGRDDLAIVVGAGGTAAPIVAGFSWNPTTFTATWTFDSALEAGKYLLHLGSTVIDVGGTALDGDWTTGLSTVSGDGSAGGNFDFRFNVLPGDFDGSGAVTFGEIGQARLKLGVTAASADFNYRQDFDGSGSITFGDVGQARLRLGASLGSFDEPMVPLSGEDRANLMTATFLVDALNEFSFAIGFSPHDDVESVDSVPESATISQTDSTEAPTPSVSPGSVARPSDDVRERALAAWCPPAERASPLDADAAFAASVAWRSLPANAAWSLLPSVTARASDDAIVAQGTRLEACAPSVSAAAALEEWSATDGDDDTSAFERFRVRFGGKHVGQGRRIRY